MIDLILMIALLMLGHYGPHWLYWGLLAIVTRGIVKFGPRFLRWRAEKQRVIDLMRKGIVPVNVYRF